MINVKLFNSGLYLLLWNPSPTKDEGMQDHFIYFKRESAYARIIATGLFLLQDTFLSFPHTVSQKSHLPSFLASLASFLASTITKPIALCSRTWATSWRNKWKDEHAKGRKMVQNITELLSSCINRRVFLYTFCYYVTKSSSSRGNVLLSLQEKDDSEECWESRRENLRSRPKRENLEEYIHCHIPVSALRVDKTWIRRKKNQEGSMGAWQGTLSLSLAAKCTWGRVGTQEDLRKKGAYVLNIQALPSILPLLGLWSRNAHWVNRPEMSSQGSLKHTKTCRVSGVRGLTSKARGMQQCPRWTGSWKLLWVDTSTDDDTKHKIGIMLSFLKRRVSK